MKNPHILDLYSDFCVSSFAAVTATGLSAMLDGGYSHDQISRFLSQEAFTQKDFWKMIKRLVRKVEHASGIISIDDTISEKPHSTENDMICWHRRATPWDHSKGCNIKGINILNFAYHTTLSDGQEVTLPLAFEIIKKTEQYYDAQQDKAKRRSPKTKNEMVRERLYVLAKHNQVAFRYVVWDTWFSAQENFDFVHYTLKKQFVAALKSNRKVALSEADKKQGNYVRAEELDFQSTPCRQVWLKGLDFPVSIAKQVFTNKDGSKGELFLISNDLTLTASDLYTIYQKRWGVEVFHKSLKQNAGLEKSPTKYEITQSNHIFASMIAYCKLEILKVKEHTNHFALKARLYLKAIKAAYQELNDMKVSVQRIEQAQQKAVTLLG